MQYNFTRVDAALCEQIPNMNKNITFYFRCIKKREKFLFRREDWSSRS